MYIAEQLRKKNIAEYLLYMWQVEDTLRAYGLDADRMAAEYIPQFGLDAEKSEAMKHAELLKSSKHPFYSAAYYKVLPFIVELRSKSTESQEKGELENCFDALYGMMLLKAQKKDISAETATAIDNIAKFIGMLSDYYKKDKAGEVEF